LQDGGRRSLSNSRILKQSEAVLFNMPALDGERDGRRLLNKAEEVQRLAYEEGFASGERAGFSAGEQKAAVLLERLEKILEEAAAVKDDLVKTLELQAVSLAIAIARKIIIEEIGMRPEIIVTMVKEALKKLQRMGTITIKINPALFDLFTANKPQLLDIHPDIVFDINSHVPVTGPLVISEIEEVVTDIDSLLSNIVEEMKIESRTSDTDPARSGTGRNTEESK
jgi:flagellar assembly protein FliH